MSLPALAATALQFANVLRAHDGNDPLPALVIGDALDCARCPVANTANMGVRSGRPRWEVGAVAVKVSRTGKPTRGKDQVPVPPTVLEFMAAFDAGMFPELLSPVAVAA